MNRKSIRVSMFMIVVGYTIIVRLLPFLLHRVGVEVASAPVSFFWSFTPVFAVSLFGGAQLRSRRSALLLPVALMLAGDLGILVSTGRADWAFYPSQFFVYSSLVVCASLGFLLRGHRSFASISGTGFLGCTLFFLITNFTHWAFQDTFPKTAEGLMACYLSGLMAYRNSLIGTAVFGSILFSPLTIREMESRPFVLANARIEA